LRIGMLACMNSKGRVSVFGHGSLRKLLHSRISWE
jgi:hypothetical protein